MAADSARHNSGEMRQVAIVIQRHAVIGHPVAHTNADCGDLVFAPAAAIDPNADAAGASFAAAAKTAERGDQPVLEPRDVSADVDTAYLEIKHRVADALARSMIGVLAATAGRKDRQPPGVQQVGRRG